MSGFLPGGSPLMGRRRAAAASSDWFTVAGQTCVAAYKAIGAADLATSYVNLANPGVNNAAPGTAPGLGAAGWSWAAASSQYLTTGIIPGATWSIFVRFVNSDADPADATANALMGKTDTNANWFIWASYSARTYVGWGSENRQPNPHWSSGVGGVAGGQVYLDGSAQLTPMTSYAGSDTRAMLIGAFNNGGTPAGFFTGTIAAIAIYKPTEPSTTPMSAAEVAALTTRMAAL